MADKYQKPEVQPEIAPETRPGYKKPEVQPEIAPEIRPEIQPEIAPEIRPEIQPEIAPEIQPEIAPSRGPIPEVAPSRPITEVAPSRPIPEVSPEKVPRPRNVRFRRLPRRKPRGRSRRLRPILQNVKGQQKSLLAGPDLSDLAEVIVYERRSN